MMLLRRSAKTNTRCERMRGKTVGMGVGQVAYGVFAFLFFALQISVKQRSDFRGVMEGNSARFVGAATCGLFLVSVEGTDFLKHFPLDGAPIHRNTFDV